MRVTSLLLLQGRHLLFTTNISSISGSHHPCCFFSGLQLSGATAHERSQTHPLIFSLLSLWSSHLSPASWLTAFLPGLPNCASSTAQLERAFEHVNRIAFLLENTAVRAGGRAARGPGFDTQHHQKSNVSTWNTADTSHPSSDAASWIIP